MPDLVVALPKKATSPLMNCGCTPLITGEVYIVISLKINPLRIGHVQAVLSLYVGPPQCKSPNKPAS